MQNSSQGFRLSPQQKSLWSAQQAHSSRAGTGQPYRAVSAILVEGDLQPRLLEKALYNVVQRHEILRTTFHRPPGVKTPFQVVSDNAHPAWQAIDLTHLDVPHRDHRVEASLAEERARLFDFERGPLLRITLLKLSLHRRVMILCLPALCADSMTLTNFVKELSHAYESVLGGQELACESMQYADFAQWQNELFEADDEHAAEGRAHWKQQTSVAASQPVLPLEKFANLANLAKLAKQAAEPSSFAFASVPIAIDRGLVKRIERLAHDCDSTISALLFAAWQAIVWRLTGRSDFVIFNLCDGRKLEDLEAALGLYARFVPVACHCEDVPFPKLLRGVQQALNQANEWQEYFEIDLPAADLAFEFEERPLRSMGVSLSFSILKQHVCIQPFKLKLSCTRAGDAIAAELQYDPQVFDRDSVERIAGYFQRFLFAVAHNEIAQTKVYATEITIGAVEILGTEERQRLLFELNRTTADYPKAKCVHELFEEQVARTPTAVALVFGDQEFNYNELNVRSNQLAHLLRRRGVAPNDCVGLCLERSAEMVIGLLGILKAGGAYVPLNPEHPRERLALQLAESKARVLITKGGEFNQHAGSVRSQGDGSLYFAGETIDLDLHRELLAAEPETNLSPVGTPDNLVYVIYTSGSTGVPKGVAVQHRNLVNYTQFVLQRLAIDAPLHFATVSTITADLGNTCIFPSLVSGGCLHVLSYDVAMEGELFRNYVTKRPIGVLKIVPSHLQALLASQPAAEILPSKYLILGGEPLSWELVERIRAADHTCQIVNHYGPTETTVGSLTFGVNAETNSSASLTVPIGRPIANTRVYALDKYLQPQPIGVAGELYIGGAGVASGYLNQAAETAARFVADPFADEAGARLYQTGDLVRHLADGNVEFLGRVDNQVKVRGFRVELGEIEAVLAAYPGVQQAIALVRPHKDSASVSSQNASDSRVVAYIVASGAKPPSQDDLRDFLKLKVPDYMIPAVFVFLKSLPLTPNGKVDRAALPAPEDARPDLQKVFVAPRTPVEKELAGIWASLLKVNDVGVHDNFFDLGGHSLLATQVVSRMRKVFQTEIPLRSLFESPTVAALAEKIESATAN
ncbi:MAG: hypothetical protein AUI36_39430, partial [Cyanobacteria bacterium 13_1_40CM_2_61_4]